MKVLLCFFLFVASGSKASVCKNNKLFELRAQYSSLMGNLKIQQALVDAAKKTKTMLIARKINPKSYEMLYEGAIGKNMNIKAKSSLRKNLNGTIPIDPYLGKNLKKLIQIDQKLKESKNISEIKQLKKSKRKLLNVKGYKKVPVRYGEKVLVYKEGTQFSSMAKTEFVKDSTNREIVFVVGGTNSDGEDVYYTADLDLYALLEHGVSRPREQFVKDLGFVSKTMPLLINQINESFTKVGFLPSSNIVNHGDEMGYGKNITKEMLLQSSSSIFPMHATDPNHNYLLIKKFIELKKLFHSAKIENYGTDGWSKNAFHQRDAIFGEKAP